MYKLVKCYDLEDDLIQSYKDEFEGEVMHGDARLQLLNNISDWKSRLKNNELISMDEEDVVRSSTYFLVDEKYYPLGVIDIRHRLNDYLLEMGGHIGYSVRKSERQKGYAKIMLNKALEVCKEIGLDRVLITADDNNPASFKTIESQGGVLENKITEEDGNILRRYWIELS